MTDNIVQHPHRDLMAEAEYERRVADSAEAEKLKKAIFDAVGAYSQFLEERGVIWGGGPDPRMKVSALVVTVDYGREFTDITLKDGALDRVYGNGVNPDPYGAGPPDIPKPRRDEDET
jgi:hypothetical protein